MSFIYGCIYPPDISVDKDFETLKGVLSSELSSSGAVLDAGAVVEVDAGFSGGSNIAVGLCHKKSRDSRAGVFQDEGILVIADIRIYNSDELKQYFPFSSPVEGLAVAYKKWGIDCASYINGDFAAVIYNKASDLVYLMRDHIGVRPLAYYSSSPSPSSPSSSSSLSPSSPSLSSSSSSSSSSPSSPSSKLIFAPDEFSIARSGLAEFSISEEYIVKSFFRYTRKYEKTVFKGIDKVLPGYVYTFSKGELINKYRYWRPEEFARKGDNKNIKFSEAVEELRRLLTEATKSRMESRPTALHVSGGIDSTGVASLVTDLAEDKSLLTGYSYSPDDFDEVAEAEAVNEKEFVEAFVEDKGIRVKYQSLNPQEYFENASCPEFSFQHIEHPTMKQAGMDNNEILFSGWGGDEFLSLSTRGVVNHLFFKFKWIELIRFAASKGIGSTIMKLKGEVLPYLLPIGLFKTYKLQRRDWSILKLLRRDFIIRNFKSIFILFDKRELTFGYGDRKKFALNLIKRGHLPTRMDTHSVNSEKYGIEYRYPLLDRKVLEYWFSLPVEFTYKNFKSRVLFREIMKGTLAERIRLRVDKNDNVFTDKIYQIRENGEHEILERLSMVREQGESSIFNHSEVARLLDKPVIKDDYKTVMNFEKIFSYIRFSKLINKYSILINKYSKLNNNNSNGPKTTN